MGLCDVLVLHINSKHTNPECDCQAPLKGVPFTSGNRPLPYSSHRGCRVEKAFGQRLRAEHVEGSGRSDYTEGTCP